MVRTSQSLFASAHDLLGIDERPDISYRASVGPHSFCRLERASEWVNGEVGFRDMGFQLSVRMGEDNGQKEAI